MNVHAPLQPQQTASVYNQPLTLCLHLFLPPTHLCSAIQCMFYLNQ